MRFLLLFVISLTCTFQNVLTDDNEGEDYDNFDYNKPRETSHDDETSRIGKASYDDETSLYGETSRYGETSSYEVAEQGEDRVFIGVNSVFEFIADPSNQSFFLLRMFGQARILPCVSRNVVFIVRNINTKILFACLIN